MLELIAGIGVLLLAAVSVLGTMALAKSPNRVKETFRCPLSGRVAAVDFLVSERAEPQVVSCSALARSRRLTCGGLCRKF